MERLVRVVVALIAAALYQQALPKQHINGGGAGVIDAMASESEVSSEGIPEKSIVWIQDHSDGHCLGAYGFGACGDANLWRVWFEGGLLKFEHVNSIDLGQKPPLDSSKSHCLGRHFSWKGQSKIGLRKCRSFLSSSLWGVSEDGHLVNSVFGMHYCIYRLGDAIRAGRCGKSHGDIPMLRPMLHSLPQVLHKSYMYLLCPFNRRGL